MVRSAASQFCRAYIRHGHQQHLPPERLLRRGRKIVVTIADYNDTPVRLVGYSLRQHFVVRVRSPLLVGGETIPIS